MFDVWVIVVVGVVFYCARTSERKGKRKVISNFEIRIWYLL
jgi:hypothetical protein